MINWGYFLLYFSVFSNGIFEFFGIIISISPLSNSNPYDKDVILFILIFE